MTEILLIICAVLAVVLIMMYVHISAMHTTLEIMGRTLTAIAKASGCTDMRSEPDENGVENFMGYEISAETREKAAKLYVAGFKSQAATELRSASRMPNDIIRMYLKLLCS